MQGRFEVLRWSRCGVGCERTGYRRRVDGCFIKARISVERLGLDCWLANREERKGQHATACYLIFLATIVSVASLKVAVVPLNVTVELSVLFFESTVVRVLPLSFQVPFSVWVLP